jgi:hypothetical protein
MSPVCKLTLFHFDGVQSTATPNKAKLENVNRIGRQHIRRFWICASDQVRGLWLRNGKYYAQAELRRLQTKRKNSDWRSPPLKRQSGQTS